MLEVSVECPVGVSEDDVRQWCGQIVAAIATPGLEFAGKVRVVKIDQCMGRLNVDAVFGPADFIANISRRVDEFESVDEFEVSTRVVNAMRELGIRTVADLVQKSEWELLKAKNFGRKSLDEVKTILSDMGLSLGMRLG